jgi:DegT/DnrJ/EryC1/StrS aminotransferase family
MENFPGARIRVMGRKKAPDLASAVKQFIRAAVAKRRSNASAGASCESAGRPCGIRFQARARLINPAAFPPTVPGGEREHYNRAFAGLPLYIPVEPAACRRVFHLYVVRCDRRDELANHIERAGIASGIHYRYPVHVQPGIAAVARVPFPLKITETVVREILTLPLYPSMTAEYRDRVVEGVRSFFGKN